MAIVTVVLSEDMHRRYDEHTGPAKGALLKRAIASFVKNPLPPSPSLVRRIGRINADPTRSISASITDDDKRVLLGACAEANCRLAELLRHLIHRQLEAEEATDLSVEIVTSTSRPTDSPFATFRPPVGGHESEPIAVVRDELPLLKSAIAQLVDSCIELNGTLPPHDGYRSTALAAIDAVFAANARYESVEKIIDHLEEELTPIFDGDPRLEGFDLVALLALHEHIASTFSDVERAEALTEFLYRNRSVIAGRRKALVVEALARCLIGAHAAIATLPVNLNGIDSFRAIWADPNRLEIARELIELLCSVRGIGPATARYFLLLLGGPFVKPDVMTTRFVERVLGRKVGVEEVAKLLEQAIGELVSERGWTFSVPQIDHLIWRNERPAEAGNWKAVPVESQTPSNDPMSYGLSSAQWDELVQRSTEILEGVARRQRTCTYGTFANDLHERVGAAWFPPLEFDNPRDRNLVSLLLARIGTQSFEQYGVVITAVVTLAGDEAGVGAGFFDLLKSLGLITGHLTADDRLYKWIELLNEVHKFYGRN